MPNFRIILAPTLAEAVSYSTTHDVVASVEAEYGDECVPGRLVTLAHHGPRAGNPAPCNDPRVRKLVRPVSGVTTDGRPWTSYAPLGGDILVSHLDLDTLGGIMAIEGLKPVDDEFWAGAAYIDVVGPHHLHELSPRVQELLNAWDAWQEGHLKARRYRKVTNVTSTVGDMTIALISILGGNEALLQAGQIWHQYVAAATEKCLIAEDALVRVFKTDGVFCNSAYYSPKQKRVVPAIASLNTTQGSITISFADKKVGVSAAKIVQSLWGPEAGGHDGIAGSPRGQIMTMTDLRDAVHAIEVILMDGDE